MSDLLEARLLLCCLQVAVGAQRPVWFRHFTPADWDGVVRQAELHGVGPLLYMLFSHEGIVRPTDAVMARLRDLYLRAAAENERKFRQLARVLAALRAEQVQVVALKGIALAQTVYADRAIRPMNDLDLLVHRADLDRAEAVLVRLGCLPLENHPGEKEWFAQNHIHLIPYADRETHTAVELHWNLLPASYGIDYRPEELWERARPAWIAGVEVLVQSPADLLCHLCLHAAIMHRFAIRLRDLFDIHQTVCRHRSGLDWQAFLEQAARYGVARPFYWLLEIAREAFGTPIESGILNRLRTDPVDACLLPLLRDQVLGNPARDVYRVLWQRQELGLDGFRKDYRDVPLGNEMVWGVEESGFQEQDAEAGRPVRWTNGTARLVVPLTDGWQPGALRVDLWPGPREASLRIAVNGCELFRGKVSGESWARTLDLTGLVLDRQVTIELDSDTFVPKPGDGRTLGVLVREVRLW